jgi:hypothetical protein
MPRSESGDLRRRQLSAEDLPAAEAEKIVSVAVQAKQRSHREEAGDQDKHEAQGFQRTSRTSVFSPEFQEARLYRLKVYSSLLSVVLRD